MNFFGHIEQTFLAIYVIFIFILLYLFHQWGTTMDIEKSQGTTFTNVEKRFFGRRQSRPLKEEAAEICSRLLPTLQLRDADIKNISTPTIIEIGFGGGEHLAEIAHQNPNINYIGCEAYVNGVGSFLRHVDQRQLKNVKVWDKDAWGLLNQLPLSSLDGAILLFADPWPKKRHHKRRFIQTETIQKMHQLLRPGAIWKIATDHVDYRSWILNHFERHKDLFEQIRPDIYERPSLDTWPKTRYESFADSEGRHSGFMMYARL
jgi:tRNA (guanine-N7-)-methyltransferase